MQLNNFLKVDKYKFTSSVIAGLVATVVLSVMMVLKGMMAPLMTLVLHIIFGAVLGLFYKKLQ